MAGRNGGIRAAHAKREAAHLEAARRDAAVDQLILKITEAGARIGHVVDVVGVTRATVCAMLKRARCAIR